MKIFILRHEDRTQDATFFSPLTELGLEKSNELIELLKELNINKIYSSPFIRTLQTIYPYTKYMNYKINLDYSLAELQHPDLIPPNSYQVTIPTYIANSFNYNKGYTSLMSPIDYEYPENINSLDKRVKNFLERILKNHSSSDDSVLLVTHQGVCNTILNIIGNSKDRKELINIKKYPKGCITKVFEDNDWKFKPINWEL